MNGGELKAWREERRLSQGALGEASRVSRRTVIRAEREADRPIPEGLRAFIDGVDADPAAAPPRKPRGFAVRPIDSEAARLLAQAANVPVVPGLDDCMKRDPPFAKTAAEARAMRDERFRQRPAPPKGQEPEKANILRLLPLRPDWRMVGRRRVNAAIPDPIDRPAPDWAGPRGALTASGEVYDYETAHRMSPMRLTSADEHNAGVW